MIRKETWYREAEEWDTRMGDQFPRITLFVPASHDGKFLREFKAKMEQLFRDVSFWEGDMVRHTGFPAQFSILNRSPLEVHQILERAGIKVQAWNFGRAGEGIVTASILTPLWAGKE